MKIPYGYLLDETQKILISQKQAEVVKQIYDLYLQGKSLGGIAQSLESQHIPSPSGNETWSRAAIDKILSNKKYIGTIIPFGKYVEVQFEKEQRSNLQPNNTRKTARYNSQNVLSGLLVCGECGKNFRRITRASGEVIWRCADKVENGRNSNCSNFATINEMDLKNHIFNELGIAEYDEQELKNYLEAIVVGKSELEIETK